MKRWLGYLLKTLASILGLLIAAILFFTVQANLRETKTRHEAAPSTGRFVQAGDVELFIQEMGSSTSGEQKFFLKSALADGLRQMFLGTPIRSICIHPPWLEADWDHVPARVKGERVTNRDVVEAVMYAITRPRHVTIASMIIDSDSQGLDYRSHLKS